MNTLRIRLERALAAGVLVCGMTAGALGASISYTDAFPDSFPLSMQETDWSQSLDIAKFNPALGVLDSVLVEMTGDASGWASFRANSSDKLLTSFNLYATIVLSRPDLTPLTQVVPLYSVSPNLVIHGGESYTFSNLNAVADDDSQLYTGAGDLALFTGVGSISLPVGAIGSMVYFGSSGLSTESYVEAGTGVKVTYNYHLIPDGGSTVLLLGLAGLGLGGFSFRRRTSR